MRCGEITPIALSLPASMKVFEDGNWSKTASIWPPMRSVIAGPEPLYGTCTMFTPAYDWKDSPSMWLMPPTPELPNEYLPGFAFTSAMNSFRLFAGNLGFTVRMFGIESLLVIDAKLSSEYSRFERSAGSTIIVLTVAMASVYPSGAARATWLVPSAPLAPPTFSTTTGCPSSRRIGSDTSRAMMSVLPPGVNGTTTLMECVGYDCAKAPHAAT